MRSALSRARSSWRTSGWRNRTSRKFSSQQKGEEKKPLLGLIGVGRMGKAMAENFLAAGHPLMVYDRHSEAVESLVRKGARRASSAEEVASQVSTLVTMLPNDAVLTQVVGRPGGAAGCVLRGLRPGSLHVSCSTVSPTTSRDLATLHTQANTRFVAAPVFARPDGIAAKAAYFVAGGEEESVREAERVLLCTGSRVYHFGLDPGAGSVVKLCGNFAIACAIEALAEALALAEKNGVDRTQVTEMLTSTIFDCIIYKGYGQRVASRDHSPGGFSLELGLKDVSLVREAAAKAGAPMPFASILHDRLLAARQRGRGELDWSALALTASEESGVDVSHAIKQSLRAGDADTKTPK